MVFFLQYSNVRVLSCSNMVSSTVPLPTSEGREFISSVVGSRERAIAYCSFASSSFSSVEYALFRLVRYLAWVIFTCLSAVLSSVKLPYVES